MGRRSADRVHGLVTGVRHNRWHYRGRLATGVVESGTMITDFHAKYFALELSRRCSSGTVEKLTGVLADAQVDLQSPSDRGGALRLSLLDEIGRRLEQSIEQTPLFTMCWRLA